MVKQIDINLDIIREAFNGDKDIFKYCDPEFEGNSVEELAEMIYNKIMEYEQRAEGKFFQTEGGYFYTNSKLLVSFGLNQAYRTPERLKEFFDAIRAELGDFDCYMHARNTRANRWLVKCGMREIESNIDQVKKFSICQ